MELFKPEFGLVFWMFFVFVVLFAILAKYAWPYIIRSIDDRADLIDKGVEYAQDAKAQLEKATRTHSPYWQKLNVSKWILYEKRRR